VLLAEELEVKVKNVGPFFDADSQQK